MIIYQNIGFAWTNKITVDSDRVEMFSYDIIAILDDMYYNRDNEELQFRLFTIEELEEEEEEYIPINGGEYYTDKIEFIKY